MQGDITFRELQKMLRQRIAPVAMDRAPATGHEGLCEDGLIDMSALRHKTRERALIMSVQAEMHNQTVVDELGDDLAGTAGVMGLGTLPPIN